MLRRTYRVFTTRTYTAVKFFDILADSPAAARRLAKRAAKRLYPDMRAVATDNGWISDDEVEIAHLGAANTPFKVTPVLTDKHGTVYQEARDE